MFRLKTGNIPPDDLPFEETPFKTRKNCGTLMKNKSEKKNATELFPKKRKIEDKIALIESDIEKGKVM